MRIVILGTRGFPDVQGGVEKHCEILAAGLVKLGCEVIVFTRKPYVDAGIKEYKGVKLVSLPAFRSKLFEAFLHTFIGVFAALKYKPDILHIQGIGPAFFSPLAKILRMKVVVTSHGQNYKHLKWGFVPRIVLRLAEFFGVIFADGLIAISKTIAGEIKIKFGKDAVVIPNGVVSAYIPEDDCFIGKYSLIRGKYILSVGRFVPEKGLHDLMEAFKSVSGWKLAIVGDADHPDRYSLSLKNKAAKNNNIILTGFLTGQALGQLYKNAGLFVLASYYEGMPIALLEAMSYGLSCIASDIPPNRDIGLSGDRFFKAGDILSLANKIREFMSKPLTDQEKKIQIQMVEERYSWDSAADRTLELYKQVKK
ncbi:MAG: glycosyltransferase family 4 protein [Candidatus Omnitrophica bacterium]|nr:glycosyltransferase family 4 protein [Candidatus Omnitrophota bacterium]